MNDNHRRRNQPGCQLLPQLHKHSRRRLRAARLRVSQGTHHMLHRPDHWHLSNSAKQVLSEIRSSKVMSSTQIKSAPNIIDHHRLPVQDFVYQSRSHWGRVPTLVRQQRTLLHRPEVLSHAKASTCQDRSDSSCRHQIHARLSSQTSLRFQNQATQLSRLFPRQ